MAHKTWTEAENRAVVKAYFDMLEAESAGLPVNKAAARRSLLAGPLAGRTKSAVELKLGNVSAVLEELGSPRIKGYVPYPNVQAALRDHVTREAAARGLSRSSLASNPTASTSPSPDRSRTATFARSFLTYWNNDQAALALEEGGNLEHAASEQFNKLESGDRLFVATIKKGRLVLLGAMTIGQVMNHEQAVRYYRARGYEPYGATFHVAARPGTASAVRERDITGLATNIAFDSSRPSLAMRGALVDQQALRSLRRLTPESAGLLEAQLADTPPATRGEASGAGYGHSDSNGEVEKAAVEFIRARLEAEGWTVDSVEDQKCGYDLRCVRGDEERHIEVKGVSGEVAEFIITAGEVRCGKRDPRWEVAIVTGARTSPMLVTYDAKGFFDRYELEPMQYRAKPRPPE